MTELISRLWVRSKGEGEYLTMAYKAQWAGQVLFQPVEGVFTLVSPYEMIILLQALKIRLPFFYTIW